MHRWFLAEFLDVEVVHSRAATDAYLVSMRVLNLGDLVYNDDTVLVFSRLPICFGLYYRGKSKH